MNPAWIIVHWSIDFMSCFFAFSIFGRYFKFVAPLGHEYFERPLLWLSYNTLFEHTSFSFNNIHRVCQQNWNQLPVYRKWNQLPECHENYKFRPINKTWEIRISPLQLDQMHHKDARASKTMHAKYWVNEKGPGYNRLLRLEFINNDFL